MHDHLNFSYFEAAQSSPVTPSVKFYSVDILWWCFFFLLGMSVRSTFWSGEKILVGTNAGEIFEVLATDKDKPRTIVQVKFWKNVA